MPAGRPPAYKTAEELQNKIDEYIQVCLEDDEPFTITGLVYYCGFESRTSFYDYEKKPEFMYTVKRARTFIEKHYEKLLLSGNATGAIFALKNFGWSDKREIDQNITGDFSGIDINIISSDEAKD